VQATNALRALFVRARLLWKRAGDRTAVLAQWWHVDLAGGVGTAMA
jgi:hypothetical protein